jgi:long-chain acyl-CoA synthetase
VQKTTNIGNMVLCGLPMPSVEMRVQEPNEEGIGELIAKAPNLMLGYYEDEEATNEVIRDGWFYTGDYGYIDKNGYVYITGRKKNTIVLKNGKKIFPEEIEENINKIDLVEECLVFGLPKEDDLVLSVKIKYDEDVIKKKYPSWNMEEVKKVIWEKVKETNKLVPKYKYIKNMILTNMDFSKTTTNKIKRYEEMRKMHLN